MTVRKWEELDRRTLREVLPGALVVLSVGAVEQHGDHLPSGTDSLIVADIVVAASRRASEIGGLSVVIAPQFWVGASDHHLPFGGTLTMRPATLLSMLGDVLGAMSAAGAERAVLVNGHGGNTGICHAAAAAAAARDRLLVAHIDYWNMLPGDVDAGGAPVPGHAGAFETALVRATRPELVREIADREETAVFRFPPGVDVHSADQWSAIDGYTDHPENGSAELGAKLREEIVDKLAAALLQVGNG